jgi:hypothetical protein
MYQSKSKSYCDFDSGVLAVAKQISRHFTEIKGARRIVIVKKKRLEDVIGDNNCTCVCKSVSYKYSLKSGKPRELLSRYLGNM